VAGVLCGIVGSFLFVWLFDNFGKLDLVLPKLNSFAVPGFMLVLKRKLWRHACFFGDHGGDRDTSSPIDSVCSLGYEVGSRNSNSDRRLSGSLSDALDS